MLKHHRHCLAFRGEWEHLDDAVFLFNAIVVDDNFIRVTIDKESNSGIFAHIKEADLINRWAIVHNLALRAGLVDLQANAVMAQIDAAEEILKGVRFFVVERKRFNTTFHFTDVFVTFKF